MPTVALAVALTPIQDLHGYDHPWAGGAGKNKLPMTVSAIKAANTDGTWSGNKYTYNNIEFSINTDSADNVTGISVKTLSGGASANTLFFLYGTNAAYADNIFKTDLLNGVPNDADINTHCINLIYSPDGSSYGTEVFETGTGSAISPNFNYLKMRIRVMQGVEVNNAIYKPMLRLSTETDASFAPYSNICPINGRDSVTITVEGVEE